MTICAELIDLWTSTNREDRSASTIVTDTCCSDAWIDELRTEQIPNFAYRAACRSHETTWLVNDRKVPCSLFIRRLFLELMTEVTQAEQDTYVWICPTQHPTFLCDYAYEHESERRVVVTGVLPFFTIEGHTEMNRDYYDTVPNGAVRHGKF